MGQITRLLPNSHCRRNKRSPAQAAPLDQEAERARHSAGGRGGGAPRWRRGGRGARPRAPARRAAEPHAARQRPARRHRARAAARY